MEARRIINGASFGPEALKVIGQAFDEAWASIAKNYGDGVEAQSARIRLARAVLAAASNDSRDAAALKQAALQSMKHNYL